MDGATPLHILLSVMRSKWAANDIDGAVALAKVAAPYMHPKVPAARPVSDLSGVSDANWTLSNVKSERGARDKVRESLNEWALVALEPQGFAPAAHHRLLIRELEGLANGRWDRLMLLLPPGSAKSTYAVVNVLLGSLTTMATSVVSYWVGSSIGSVRKDARIANLQAQTR